jgi:hypothetical protein
MHDILPVEAYERPFVGPARRTIIAMAVLWGVPMTLLFVLSTYRSIGVVFPLLVGAVGGPGFGVFWTRSFRRRMRAFVRRLYEADPALVPALPPGVFDCRVSCSLIPSGRIAVGGHLYAGPADWVFVPHQKNLPRHRAPTVLSISADVTLTPGKMPRRGLARLLTSEPIHTLDVRTAGGMVRLYVPEPELVAAKLLQCAARDARPRGHGPTAR